MRPAIDANGVDVLRGTFWPVLTDISIGPGDHRGLAYRRVGGVASPLATIEAPSGPGNGYVVTIEGQTTQFYRVAGTNDYTPANGDGSTLVDAGGIITVTLGNGMTARFATNQGYTYQFYEGEYARLASITYPDGVVISFTYRVQTYCPNFESGICQGQTYYIARLQSINHSNGYQLKPFYVSNSTQVNQTNYASWGQLVRMVAINNAIDHCDPAGTSCSAAADWPTATYFSSGAVNDAAGRPVKSYVAVTNDAAGRVATATNDMIGYTYAYVDNGTTRTTTVTDQYSKTRVYVGDLSTMLISSVTDELNRTTSYLYDGNGRLTQVTYPEGNKVEMSYDARGNIVQTTLKAKPNTGLADITTTANYDATCSNPKTCNQPNWARDAKGAQTDYTYDPGHGGVLTITAPAPTNGAVRPQSRFTYTPLTAYYKMSSSGTPIASVPTYVLTATSVCATQSSCTGSSDEVKTTITYGPQTQGVGNNLLPLTAASGSGDGLLTATVTTAYDTIGNALTVDGPIAGSADTVRYRYDASRLPVGMVGPDPDGSGSLKNRAIKTTYNNDRLATLVERGTVDSQSDPDWANFVSLQQVTNTYDAGRRKLTETLSASGTNYSRNQYSYDNLGRMTCSTLRMNPTAYGSLSADACVAGTTGAQGPDRITKRTYDDASQLLKTTSALGTADQSDDATLTYSQNGKPTSLTDAKGNITTQTYDGFDRALRLSFPNASGSGTSTSDYEQFSYDVNGNIITRRLRNGATITIAYDALNRMTGRFLPTGNANLNPTYAYDNRGRLTQASNGGIYTTSTSYTYDALGRTLSESEAIGGRATLTRSMQYDLAGRRTRVTWPDTLYIVYDYDNTGAMTAIRENGATSGVGLLATFGYDNLGQRTLLTRGNGTTTSYAYDPASRLSSLSHDLAGTTNDLTLSFAGYNPAGQIGSRTASNDLYAWTGASLGTKSYAANGLNQYTSAAGVTPTYDPRGNLTRLGSQTFSYSAENLLALTGGSSRFYYDALNRLFFAQPSLRRLERDGGVLTAEYNNADQLVGRYVLGPGIDEPVVWYDGTGTATRRWLHADERGSIVAVSDQAGVKYAINTYDEYGQPDSGNVGRFQYTGQVWASELGMYDYKARIYSPLLGRLLQVDPIVSSINLYGYASSDPIGLVDPTGMAFERSCSTGTLICGRTSAATVNVSYTGNLSGVSSSSQNGSQGASSNNSGGVTSSGSPNLPNLNSIVVTADFAGRTRYSQDNPFGGSPQSEQGDIVVVAYQGKYHDAVANDLANMLNSHGVRAVREFGLCLGSTGVCARPDIFGIDPKSGRPFFIEVKTGINPRWTPNQLAVYSHTDAAGAYRTFDIRAPGLGLGMGLPLPAVSGFLYYKKDANTPGVTVPIGF